MEFTIEKEVFLKGLSRVQGIVEKRNTIPILSNILIESNTGGIFITATDLEVGMKAFYPANIVKSGKITISAKKLYEITKELPDKEIIFKTKENSWVEIKCGKSIFNIVGLAADEFPYFPEPENDKFIVSILYMSEEIASQFSGLKIVTFFPLLSNELLNSIAVNPCVL